MTEPDQQRTEEPTPHKLEEARKKGQTARSMDLGAFVVTTFFTLAVLLSWRGLVNDQLTIGRAILRDAGTVDLTSDSAVSWLSAIVTAEFRSLAPLLLAVTAIAVVSNLVQTGPIFSFWVIKPHFDRVNPIAGLRRLFSVRTLREILKAFLKAVLFAAALYVVIRTCLHKAPALDALDVHALPRAYLDLALKVLVVLLALLALFALIDLVLVRREFHRIMRMSRRELRDEIKQREGDPRVRSRIKELRAELLRRARSLPRVKDADVLITNPAHLAVALQYRREETSAPVVIAKGAGEFALRMRELAGRHGVAIVENRELARALFRSADLGATIPSSLYAQVARILVWVYASRQRAALAAG